LPHRSSTAPHGRGITACLRRGPRAPLRLGFARRRDHRVVARRGPAGRPGRCVRTVFSVGRETPSTRWWTGRHRGRPGGGGRPRRARS